MESPKNTVWNYDKGVFEPIITGNMVTEEGQSNGSNFSGRTCER